MASDVVEVKLQFILPDEKCLFRISKKYPDLVFKNISMLPLPENMGNTLVEVNGARVDQLLDDIGTESNIASAKVVFRTTDHVLVNVQVNEPLILNLLGETKVMLGYPVIFQDGKGHITLIGERKDIDVLLERFEAQGVEFTIKSIGGSTANEVLSEKQKQVLVKALKVGFFETPRKVSLTTLAREFDVSPTALSEMLRRLSKKLAEHYIKSSA
jgi:predicted DNA binding protein